MSTFVAITPHTYEVVTSTQDLHGSLQQIADSLGVTRERARQIGEQQGYTSPHPDDYRSPKQVRLIRSVSDYVLDHVRVGDVLTTEQVAAAFPHASRSHVMAAIRDAELEPLLNDTASESREKFTDDAIYEALRQASPEGEATLSGEQYDMWRGFHKEAPSRSLIIHRFGTWSAACSAAGVGVLVRKERGWTRDGMWAALYRFAEDMMRADAPLTFGNYTQWAKTQSDPVPSGSTLKARLFLHTPWRDIRVMLIQHLYRQHGDRWVREVIAPA